jgi:ubiquinone/menaquinone biosynthesis C-methylase UbiE
VTRTSTLGTESLERRYRITAYLYDFLDWPWERLYRRWRPEILGDLQGTVLEVGVGTGRNLPFYPPEVRLHAVDLSEQMLARARRRVGSARCPVSLRKADALALDHLDEASFDWYVSTFLYCVLPDELQPPALDEMARVLVPGGRFRLLEILYSDRPLRRLPQMLLAPYARLVFGARFDRRTREHLRAHPKLEITRERWLKGDTHLLIEGRKVLEGGAGQGRV